MKSRITIEIDFRDGTPYINVLGHVNGDDVRDKAIENFRGKFAHKSCWCKVHFVGFDSLRQKETGEQFHTMHITPIKPEDLKKECKAMAEQIQPGDQDNTDKLGLILGNLIMYAKENPGYEQNWNLQSSVERAEEYLNKIEGRTAISLSELGEELDKALS